ncbi:MAG TPA: Xaa-Pro peptidase family protein [Chlamydiales bacterium]|nr:Xaa-Pro peptidase family protein [Chlamydiales bacterium]
MFTERIKRLQENVKDGVLFVDDPIDLYYLTGLHFSLGRLVISVHFAKLFVDGRYIDVAKKQAPCDVFLLSEIKQHVPLGTLAFDSAFLSFESYLNLQKEFPNSQFVPSPRPLKDLRIIKDEHEIALLKKAQQLTRAGLQYIVSLLKEGISEEILALEFEFFCRKNGASKLSFAPIVAFGENSAYPHHRAGKDRLKQNQIVLIDVGAVVDGYAGDMTRVEFFGNVDEQLQKDYALIKQVQKRVISHVKPGLHFGELDKIARDGLDKEGCGALFTHGLSHGIGLDVHEYPRLTISGGDSDLRLKPGMTFTVEPGIYRAGLGGVRYEDVVLVTNEGHVTL